MAPVPHEQASADEQRSRNDENPVRPIRDENGVGHTESEKREAADPFPVPRHCDDGQGHPGGAGVDHEVGQFCRKGLRAVECIHREEAQEDGDRDAEDARCPQEHAGSQDSSARPKAWCGSEKWPSWKYSTHDTAASNEPARDDIRPQPAGHRRTRANRFRRLERELRGTRSRQRQPARREISHPLRKLPASDALTGARWLC